MNGTSTASCLLEAAELVTVVTNKSVVFGRLNLIIWLAILGLPGSPERIFVRFRWVYAWCMILCYCINFYLCKSFIYIIIHYLIR